jgi:hypothetical protein
MLIVKAMIPRLKTKAPKQWNIDVRRKTPEVISTSEVWKVIPRHEAK